MSFDLYPAIDLRGGRCVRLYQGDYDRETHYGDDPVGQARAFAEAGAPWIHVVDLDAARSGRGDQPRRHRRHLRGGRRAGAVGRRESAPSRRPPRWPMPEWPAW